LGQKKSPVVAGLLEFIFDVFQQQILAIPFRCDRKKSKNKNMLIGDTWFTINRD